jgi:catechol 2,3-dioxygenase-like lactoylglutathione lyase family enzyme
MHAWANAPLHAWAKAPLHRRAEPLRCIILDELAASDGQTLRRDLAAMATQGEDLFMRINLTSVFVDDQRAALAFYTDILGFTPHRDIPVGSDSWLTVVSPESPRGPELLLEPAGHPAVKPYRDALVEDGIPLAQFAVDDVYAEHARLTGLGVVFTQAPTDIGPAVVAVFDDTCGNLIQIIAEKDDTNGGH